MHLKLLVYLVVLVVLTVTGNPPDQIVVISVVVYLFVCMLGVIVCLLVFIYLFILQKIAQSHLAVLHLLEGRFCVCLVIFLKKKKKKNSNFISYSLYLQVTGKDRAGHAE